MLVLPARPRGQTFNHGLTRCSQSGVPQGRSQNTSKFQPVPRTLPNHENAPQGTQKVPKMRSQSVPEDTQTTNNPKRWHLMKTSYLQWFRHIRALGSGVISTPKPLKNLPWNPYCHLGAPNHEKVTQMTPSESKEGPKIHPKSTNIWAWTPRCPMGCPQGSLDHPNSLPGCQNGVPKPPK